jgi:ABC-type cobalamin/Fe3+-siderophores transport system ATPase subunit
MSDYQGMRWFKCDLQMQTPADAPHWRGANMGTTAEEHKEAARAYIRRCYEVGLEAIAITDHNYLSKSFIPLLQEAIHELTGEFGYRMVLFPGFEFEADVGKGVHVLGIFEPDANLEELDHLLTECGVGYPRVQGGVLSKSTRRLPELLKCIQQVSPDGKQRGIVVMPHALKDDGLFDNGKVSEWLQQTEYLNPDLLAVEVPKPVHQMSPGWRRLFGARADCDAAWRRQRPVACIMSSDNKALTKEENAENYIGMRYTWVKMSEPSVEALRQAFLDHESRIRLQTVRPSDDERHPRLVSISVKGAAFVEDQVVHFSPNLNCVIGGRGSGKSSLLEYIRFCFQPDYLSSVDADLHEKLKGIHRTVQHGDAELHVSFEVAPGVLDTVLLKPSAKEHRLINREVHDLRTVLDQMRVQFFSQGELSRLSKPGQKNQVLRLIDASCSERLSELASQESAVRGELEKLFASARQAETLAGEVQRTKQELDELTRQWQARKEIQADAAAHRLSQEAKQFVAGAVALANSDAARLRAAISELDPVPELPESAAGWPNAEWFSDMRAALLRARESLSAEVEAAVGKYTAAIQGGLEGHANWPAVSSQLNEAEEKFLAACRDKGVLPADVSKLQEVDRLRNTRQADLDAKQKQLAVLHQQAADFDKTLSRLHTVWREQFEARKAACTALQRPTTLVAANFMLDARAFDAAWERLAPRDSRTRLGRSWEDIGRSVFAAFAQTPAAAAPWEVLQQWLKSPESIPEGSSAAPLAAELLKHMETPDVRAIWEKVRLTRVDDLIDVELKRPDGTSAGRMSGEGGKVLSEGQRNTALLSLILAEGTGPIVIDQPEDELDSNYIFSDLVPMLRHTKNGRQLVLATHNANLPVNADAELIYAFDAQDGKGKTRTQGGLDRADVTKAVLDIMEGSEQAFKQRSEKYHF